MEAFDETMEYSLTWVSDTYESNAMLRPVFILHCPSCIILQEADVFVPSSFKPGWNESFLHLIRNQTVKSNNRQTQWLLKYRISLSRLSDYTWTISRAWECTVMFKKKKRALPFSSLQFVVSRHVVSLSHVSDRWQRSASRSSRCFAPFFWPIVRLGNRCIRRYHSRMEWSETWNYHSTLLSAGNV